MWQKGALKLSAQGEIMTKDEIIRMARVAGFEQGLIRFGADAESIEFFAAIIAAAEREALETIIKQIKNDWEWAMDSQMKVYAAEYLLSVIRARGQS